MIQSNPEEDQQKIDDLQKKTCGTILNCSTVNTSDKRRGWEATTKKHNWDMLNQQPENTNTTVDAIWELF